MEREALIKYLKALVDERDMNFGKSAEFKKVLMNNINNYLKDDKVLSLFKDNVRSIGADLNESGQLKEAFLMYEDMQSGVFWLWKQGRIDYTEKNSFDVMQIKCLALMDKKQKAINRALQVFSEFMRNKNRIFKDVRNPKSENIVYLLSSIKAICTYAKCLCVQLGNSQEASNFCYREQTVRRYLRSHWGVEATTDYELCNEHRALSPSTNIYIGNHLSQIKGKFKRLKFRLNIISGLIRNWWSYLF